MKSNSKLENYQAKQDLISNRAVRSKRDNRVFLAVAAGAASRWPSRVSSPISHLGQEGRKLILPRLPDQVEATC